MTQRFFFYTVFQEITNFFMNSYLFQYVGPENQELVIGTLNMPTLENEMPPSVKI